MSIPRITEQLQALRKNNLFRLRNVRTQPQQPICEMNGKPLLQFCSNDYLGLANDPRVSAAFKKGVDKYGVGAGASHLINGHTAAHHELEMHLAEFLQCERALVFSTGYMANLGVVGALATSKTIICEDRLNHASLIDAGRMNTRKLLRYHHVDVEHLRAQLLPHVEKEILILTDGVFSMDGDIAPIPKICELANSHNAIVIVDDAHGIGVLGQEGRGSTEHLNVHVKQNLIVVGTLGKAFGTFGAFVAGDAQWIEWLIQRARTYIYTTALPPAIATATIECLRVVREESWRRDKLKNLIAYFQEGLQNLGLPVPLSVTPIQPLVIGEPSNAVQASKIIEEHGVFVVPIRPPSVAEGSARLRITLSALHTEEHVDRLLRALAACRLFLSKPPPNQRLTETKIFA